jgi:hypothetical protein
MEPKRFIMTFASPPPPPTIRADESCQHLHTLVLCIEIFQVTSSFRLSIRISHLSHTCCIPHPSHLLCFDELRLWSSSLCDFLFCLMFHTFSPVHNLSSHGAFPTCSYALEIPSEDPIPRILRYSYYSYKETFHWRTPQPLGLFYKNPIRAVLIQAKGD